jgi:ornithine carbamoyltransferase
VSAEVADGPRAVVFDQAENRLHTSVALLSALLDGALEGAS